MATTMVKASPWSSVIAGARAGARVWTAARTRDLQWALARQRNCRMPGAVPAQVNSLERAGCKQDEQDDKCRGKAPAQGDDVNGFPPFNAGHTAPEVAFCCERSQAVPPRVDYTAGAASFDSP